ncbi:MAG: C40 family peptidase, partial [Gaiellaceae bacterium]
LKAAETARQRRLEAQARARLSAPPPSSPDVSTTSAPPATHGGVVGIAMQYLGTPYQWGGSSPSTGFDCSGFVMFVYAQVGVSLPHNAAMQYSYGSPVSRSQLQPGDLVFFNGLAHNGIYIGGNQFIHSPHTGDVVKISSLSGWYDSTFYGARRL